MTTGEQRLQLRLYLACESPNSVAALANVRKLLADHPLRPVDFEVIDVLQDPERGLQAGILMTPMLVRIAPAPERRILGSLRDRAMLMGLLAMRGADGE